jgi:hypothetical protein
MVLSWLKIPPPSWTSCHMQHLCRELYSSRNPTFRPCFICCRCPSVRARCRGGLTCHLSLLDYHRLEFSPFLLHQGILDLSPLGSSCSCCSCCGILTRNKAHMHGVVYAFACMGLCMHMQTAVAWDHAMTQCSVGHYYLFYDPLEVKLGSGQVHSQRGTNAQLFPLWIKKHLGFLPLIKRDR